MRLPGPLGEFYRNGGAPLIVDGLPLTDEDLVIDGGGYKGVWASDIFCRYGSRIIIFEPLPQYADYLRRFFGYNRRVEVVQAALSNRNGDDTLSVQADSSTRFPVRAASTLIPIRIIDIADFLPVRGIGEIGCLGLNIEGSEYEVLERLIEVGLISRIRSLIVQFHMINASSHDRRNAIRAALSRTHQCNFEYPFVWEGWTRKTDARWHERNTMNYEAHSIAPSDRPETANQS